MEHTLSSPSRSPEPTPERRPASSYAERKPALPTDVPSGVRDLFEKLFDPRTVAGCIIMQTRKHIRVCGADDRVDVQPTYLLEERRSVYFRLHTIEDGVLRTIRGTVTEVRFCVLEKTAPTPDSEPGEYPRRGRRRTDDLVGWNESADPGRNQRDLYGRVDGRPSALVSSVS